MTITSSTYNCFVSSTKVSSCLTSCPMALLSSRPLFLGSVRCLQQCLRTPTHEVLRQACRTFALSRFPTRRTIGAGRSRETLKPFRRTTRGQSQDDSQPMEVTPSAEESRIWHTSQRPPTSNTEEGLQKLLMQNDTLIIERQLEMLNIFVGFEQCNKYTISNEEGEPLGFIAEEDRGFLGVVSRQAFATHRPFRAVILDASGSPILWCSAAEATLRVDQLADNTHLKAIQSLTRLGRLSKYGIRGADVMTSFSGSTCLKPSATWYSSIPEPTPAVFTQVAQVDSPFLAWDFRLLDGHKQDIAFISRAFRGFGREIFTDTGRYSVCFKPVTLSPSGQDYVPQSSSRVLSLDERATEMVPSYSLPLQDVPYLDFSFARHAAVNIDSDYFSRHSHMGRSQTPSKVAGSSISPVGSDRCWCGLFGHASATVPDTRRAAKTTEMNFLL
ncbi:hypothetical protein D9756_001684 [Leucocoprinus leucothites]|uniref:Phospholipid scramblase n=1 Tax=Leucocoprinus leucothites TaxID=201217 RepID=A0A8H5G438_9AGAR|nr:hypothetical protein D9756_001684 [Leucoagaricus leucothites]